MMPLVILEALASGLPILCSDLPQLKELLGPIWEDCVLTELTARGIAKSINKIFDSKPEVKKLLIQKEQSLAKTFTWDKTTNILNKLFTASQH